jgi:RHS repeat-associated protein
MFQFKSEQIALIRRKQIGDALIATFAGSPVCAHWNGTNDCVFATDPLGHSTEFGFDAQGFIGTVTSPTGRQWRIETTSDGKPKLLKNPADHALGFAYSPDGQLDSISSSGRASLQLLYNERKMQAGVAFPDGTSSLIGFTPWNSPAVTTNRLGNREAYEYDKDRRLTAFTDGNGSRTQFRYSRWSRPDATIFPNGAVESYAYNDRGSVSQIASDSSSVNLVCNDKGRPLQMKFSDGTEVSFKYNGKGSPTEATIGDYACKAIWNDEGRLVEEHNGDAVVLYEYDKAGRLTGMTYPTGEKIEYQWDADSRLVQVSDWNGGKHSIRYAEHDRGFTQSSPNGLATHTALNDLGLPESIAVVRHANAVFSLGYGYDRENRVAALRDSVFGDRTFRYDAEGQLLAASSQSSAQSESFQYDAAGNPVRFSGQAAGFDAANQMLSHGPSRFAYDGRGNLVAMETADGTRRFAYNARNQMVRAESPSGEVTTYAYDAYGRRIRKTKGTATVEFVWAGEQLISEVVRTGDTVIRRDYLCFPGTFTPLAMRVNGRIYSYHTDHLGTPRMLTAPDGSIAWSADYSSYGEARVARAAVENPLRAPGQYFDAETGLHYNRFRYYSPAMGRYVSRDPLSFLADSNFYRYSGNNPINQTDPLGLLSNFWKAAIVIGASVAVAAAVIAFAPVALPVAIVLAGAAAGAVGGGLNQALNEKSFCLPCILKAAGLGAIAGTVAALPALLAPAAAGMATLMGLGAVGGGLSYGANVLDGSKPHPSWTGLGESIAIGAGTAGLAKGIDDALPGKVVEEATDAISDYSTGNPKVLTPDPGTPEARQALARDFFKQNTDPAQWPDARIDSHLKGIDFTKPVQTVELPKGYETVQYQQPGNPVGNYLTPPGTSPNTLGINPAGRVPTTICTNESTPVLQSTAEDTLNNPDVPPIARGAGGGTQYFTPNPRGFTPKP